MPSAYRLPFCMSWAPVCPEKGRADRQTGWGPDGDRHPPSQQQSGVLRVCHPPITQAKFPFFSQLQKFHSCDRHSNCPEILQWLLELLLLWKGQNFTSRDSASEGPGAGWWHPCSLTPCCAAARHLSNFCQETSFSWWINQETAWKAQHKKAEIGLWCSCLKSLSDQFQSKTYVQTKGPIYFKIHLTAWKAFLYLFGILRAWLLPMKYIPVSEALLFIQTQQFSSPTVFNLWILVLFSYKE